MSDDKQTSITFDKDGFNEEMRYVFNTLCNELYRERSKTRGEVMDDAITMAACHFKGEDWYLRTLEAGQKCLKEKLELVK